MFNLKYFCFLLVTIGTFGTLQAAEKFDMKSSLASFQTTKTIGEAFNSIKNDLEDSEVKVLADYMAKQQIDPKDPMPKRIVTEKQIVFSARGFYLKIEMGDPNLGEVFVNGEKKTILTALDMTNFLKNIAGSMRAETVKSGFWSLLVPSAQADFNECDLRDASCKGRLGAILGTGAVIAAVLIIKDVKAKNARKSIDRVTKKCSEIESRLAGGTNTLTPDDQASLAEASKIESNHVGRLKNEDKHCSGDWNVTCQSLKTLHSCLSSVRELTKTQPNNGTGTEAKP